MVHDEARVRRVDTDVRSRARRVRAALDHATGVAMPYGFAVSGLVLGAGALVTGRELAGACGAVAGVTAGLLERHRATIHERRGNLLREKLRDQRAESELEASGLRRQVRDLQTALWERDLRDLRDLRAPQPVLGPPSGPIAEVIDLTEARESSAPAGEEPAAHDEGRAAG
jgi:hypothetical protein